MRTNVAAYREAVPQGVETPTVLQFMLHRRFADFDELYREMALIAPGVLPPFPPKVLFGRFDPSLIEQRRTQLEEILKVASRSRLLKKSSPLIGFCQRGRIPLKEVGSHFFFLHKNQTDNNFQQ